MLSLRLHLQLPDLLRYPNNFLFYIMVFIARFFQLVHQSLWLVSELLNLMINEVAMIGLRGILKKKFICFHSTYTGVFCVRVLVWWAWLLKGQWRKYLILIGLNGHFLYIWWGGSGRFFKWMMIRFKGLIIFMLLEITSFLQIIEVGTFLTGQDHKVVGEIILIVDIT